MRTRIGYIAIALAGTAGISCINGEPQLGEVEEELNTPPTSVMATPAGPDRMTVSWSAVAGATKYYIYQSTGGPAGPFVYINSKVAPGTSLPVAGLSPSTQYCYQVRTTDQFGTGAPSSPPACATTGVAASSLPAPTNVTVNMPTGSDRANVSWDAVPGATKYYVYESFGTTGPYNYINTRVAPGTTLQVAGLMPDENYCYKVAAFDGYYATAQSLPGCSLAAPTCPNGVIDPGEDCDDSNSTDGDGCSSTCETEALYISQYIEGTGNNKSIEIYNPRNLANNLATNGCQLRYFFNGSSTAGLTINLTGTVAGRDVYVVSQASANAAILAQTDQTSAAAWFNGDDAIELRCNSVTLDVIGQIGFDPGTEWGTGNVSTADNTLQRQCGIYKGDSNGSDAFNPQTGWSGFATDTTTGLGDRSECP